MWGPFSHLGKLSFVYAYAYYDLVKTRLYKHHETKTLALWLRTFVSFAVFETRDEEDSHSFALN